MCWLLSAIAKMAVQRHGIDCRRESAVELGCWMLLQAALLKGRDEQELAVFAADCSLPCLSADIIVQVMTMMMMTMCLSLGSAT